MAKNTEPGKEALNLKHDTMEYAAPASGQDKLDADDVRYEEDAISAEELEAINDSDENVAAALIAESTDFAADDSNLPEEDWTDDLPDNEPEEEKRKRL